MSDTQTEKPQRPVPKANRFVNTEEFWQATRNGELLLQYCPESGRFQHYPRPVSVYTGSRNLEWRKVTGSGTIYACTTVRVPGPGLEGRLPLSVVTVELDEGVRILGNILGTDPADVAIGQRVELAWDAVGDEVRYPAFKLTGS